MNSTHDHARDLLRRGYAVVPVPHRSKGCVAIGWPDLRITEEQLSHQFRGGLQNVGVLMGAPSGGRVDIDVDHAMAVEMADATLPHTGAVWGRASKPKSHRVFMPSSSMVSEQFQAVKVLRTAEGKEDRKTIMIVEIRSDRLQSLAPGSVHPSGEEVRWDLDGEPTVIAPAELRAAVVALADAAFNASGLASDGWTKSWIVSPKRGVNLKSHRRESTGVPPIDCVLNALAAKGIAVKPTVSGWSCRCPGHADSNPSLSVAECDDQRVLLHCHAGCPTDQVVFALGLTMRDLMPPQANASSAQPPSGGSVGASGGGQRESWPEPRPLPEALPPVMKFDATLLPLAVRAWIVDIADRVQCPIDFPAVAVMVALASILGRKLGIRPKRHDDWTVVPNLWGGVIGRPGVMKTPAILEPLKPLKRLEMQAKEKYDAECEDAEVADIVGEVQKKETAKEIKKALKNPDEAHRLARESIRDEKSKPVRRRHIVNDSTVEKIGELLNQNPNGFLVYRDELIGLLKSLDKEGQEGARAFYLESWNGTGMYTYDRIGRGTLDIEAAITSIIGAIQPGPLSQYLRGAAREGTGDDGLIQRFQLLVWPDISKEWKNVDRWPDSEARKRAWDVFDGLDHLEPVLAGADTDPMDPGGIPFLRFAEDAQVAFDAWREQLERKVRGGELHPAFESHLAKYRSLIPSLALLIHLADGNTGPVGIGPLNMAIRWGEYLESHARRIYSQAIHPDVTAARALAKKLLAREIPDGFALRDVYRNGWSGLATSQDALGAVDLLRDLDWLVDVREQTAGRTATTFYINPRIYENTPSKNPTPPPGGTDRTDKSPISDPSGGSVSGERGGSLENTPGGDWGSV